jgi:hypothetical protein
MDQIDAHVEWAISLVEPKAARQMVAANLLAF